jgi:hypothetical protein
MSLQTAEQMRNTKLALKKSCLMTFLLKSKSKKMTSIQIIGEEDFVLHKKGSENKQEPCK